MKQTSSMRVPYGLSVHGQEEIDAVVKVLKGNTALGPNAKEFEQKIADSFGKKFGVMVNSGSSANLLAFELLNLPKGSEVITPVLTFATTVAPIVQKGLVPVFVDVQIHGRTFQVDVKEIEKAITKKTKALMIPSLMGNIPDYKRLNALAKKHNLYLIEDSCDTLGATIDKKPTGLHSHISVTSFYGSHIINGAGGGGMICVNDPQWARRLVVLRGWGRESSLFGEKTDSEQLKNRFYNKIDGKPYDAKFIFSEVGYNFLPLELSAAFGLVQLKKFPKFKTIRQKNFARLLKFFRRLDKYFSVAEQAKNVNTAWLAFPLVIKKGVPFNRLDIVTFLEQHNIQTRPVFTGNILKQPGFRRIHAKEPKSGFPNTEIIMHNAFVIGCHHGLNSTHLDYLENVFEKFLAQYD